MNDLTKEELLIILLDLENKNPSPTSKVQVILNKIKCMIDNYCDHKSVCDHDWWIGFGSAHSPVVYCKECGDQKPTLTKNDFNKFMIINNES